jgi:hypothetical protein
MRTHVIVALTAALLGWAPAAHGQRTTEQYIPVGESPGVSGTRSYTGAIVAVDVARRTITVGAPDARRTIRVTDQTRIWLDRSAQKQTNTGGRMTDLVAGRQIEVAFADEARTVAQWIKVVVP